jgi:hypothetical protein
MGRKIDRKGGEMSYFDTLTRDDTLIFSQALGLNRPILIEEVKIQYVYPNTQTREVKHLI